VPPPGDLQTPARRVSSYIASALFRDQRLSVLAYLNPKRGAAHEIAMRVISQGKKREALNQRNLEALKFRDRQLFDMVVQELDKHDYRIPIDS
jgi:hypothetical protein